VRLDRASNLASVVWLLRRAMSRQVRAVVRTVDGRRVTGSVHGIWIDPTDRRPHHQIRRSGGSNLIARIGETEVRVERIAGAGIHRADDEPNTDTGEVS
jgi:hypothetical protein